MYLRRLLDSHFEADAARVVRRGLAEVAGEAEAYVRDVGVVACGRAAPAAYGRVDEGRAVVIRVSNRSGWKSHTRSAGRE